MIDVFHYNSDLNENGWTSCGRSFKHGKVTDKFEDVNCKSCNKRLASLGLKCLKCNVMIKGRREEHFRKMHPGKRVIIFE